MLREIRPAIVLVITLTLLTGVVYPFAITGIAQVVFPNKAQGSLVERDGKVIGPDERANALQHHHLAGFCHSCKASGELSDRLVFP